MFPLRSACSAANVGIILVPSGRISQLDGVRGIAVGLVVLFHYCSDLNLPIIGQAASHGWVGVDLFFVMSGFLIGGIVIANREADNLFAVFYFRRFLRIFPLYYALLITVTVCVWLRWMPSTEHRPLIYYFLYLQNINGALTGDPGLEWLRPTWSLAVEEQFYLFLPMLVVLTPPRFLIPAIGTAIFVSISARFLLYIIPVERPQDFALFFTPCRSDDLFYGVLLAWLVRCGHTSISLKRRIIYCYTGAAIFLTGFLILYQNAFLLFTVGLSLLGPLFFCVVALSILHERGPISLITNTRILQWIGIRTYAIYLFHVPALSSIRALIDMTGLSSHGLTRPLAIALTLACAAISWSLFEAPLIKLGHNMKYGPGAKPLILTVEP